MAPKGKGKKGEDEDEESPFMPLEDVFRKLKAGAMKFGMYLTTDKDNPVLIAAHKRKNPEFLAKQAKKEAGTTKGAFGTMTLESGELRFECENEKVPKSMQKKLRVMLKTAGFMKFKPKILLPGGAELGEADDDEDEDDEDLRKVVAPGGAATKTRKGGSASAGDGGGDEDPQEARLKESVTEKATEIMPDLEKLMEGDDETAARQAKKLAAMIAKAVEDGDWKKALATLALAQKLVKAGGVETAEKNAEAAEAEQAAAEDRSEDEVRPEMKAITEAILKLKAEVKEIEDEMQALADAMQKDFDDGGIEDADVAKYRKKADALKKRLQASEKEYARIEKEAQRLDGVVQAMEGQGPLIEALRKKIAAMEDAIAQAEAVEGEVDEAIDAEEDAGGEIDPAKAERLKAAIAKKLKAGLN